MVKYTIQRIVLAIITAFIVLTMTYFLMYLLPYSKPIGTDNARIAYYLSQAAKGYVWYYSTPQKNGLELLECLTTSDGMTTYYFYRVPAHVQYFKWLTNVFTKWEWGTSVQIQANADAMAIIASRIGTTIKINIWPVIISVPMGIALGVWAALKKNKLTDHIISTVIMIFISVPSFIVITFLLLVFVYNTGWLPARWPTQMQIQSDPSMAVKGYIIPVMALSFGSICGYCRFTRAELTEVMSSDFLLLARTKGLTKRQTIVRHAMKNAMVPILPSILAEVIGLLGGSMILEQIYSIPGVGRLYVTAINMKDYNVLMADMSLYTTIGLLSGVFLDLSYGFIDPRIRMGAKK